MGRRAWATRRQPADPGKRPMRMTIRLLPALLLAGCGVDSEPAVDLSWACQLAKCICAAEEIPFFAKRETAPVQWEQDGTAYCSEGFVLQPADEK